MNPDPFAALGLSARPDLSDEQVRAAWRSIAAATHPDRPDGGDLARYTAASAAYAQLRSPWARSEAYADLIEQNEIEQNEPDTSPLPPVPADAWPAPVPPWQPLIGLAQVPARIRRGRPLRLLIRGAVAAALSVVVLHLIPGTAAAPADVFGLTWWFVLTGRRDLAPPPER
ncbi:MAG TPA: J domain-containing protein [Streptosporangiaceae bacterium]|nr:J domain-containing protein [Streptosporangiaceae bacterium]